MMIRRIGFILMCLLLTTLGVQAQSFTLQGKVTDQDNNPVELATVSVWKQGKVAMTNLKGEFSMTLQSADSVEVKFSMIGYKTKTRVLRRPQGKQTLQIQLFDESKELGEVVVTERIRQTGSTQQLDKKDISYQTVVAEQAQELIPRIITFGGVAIVPEFLVREEPEIVIIPFVDSIQTDILLAYKGPLSSRTRKMLAAYQKRICTVCGE
jgi:hypothetical protein